MLVIGVAVATVSFAYRYGRRRNLGDTYRPYRQSIGRAILLRLELLVGAANFVRTVAASPTFDSVGVLALIVVIRTFLSFSLQAKLDGRWPWPWPWQRQPPDDLGVDKDTAPGR